VKRGGRIDTSERAARDMQFAVSARTSCYGRERPTFEFRPVLTPLEAVTQGETVDLFLGDSSRRSGYRRLSDSAA
jgi:hypothetical protein